MLGLSILLPVYNREVTRLVQALVAQAADWGGSVELICLDDGSSEYYRLINRKLADLPLVSYEELPHNLGRSAVRNRLVATARMPWLLLLDNNVSLPDTQFLARYAAATTQTTAPVLVGGTTYSSSAPADPATHLRWHYGRRREAYSAEVRQQKPHAQFKLKNVMLRAEVFEQVKLDSALRQYGHEDTKFGWHLLTAGIPVHHLDNPVLHDGLEPAEVFLLNSQQAVHNLVQLYRTEGLGADTKLLLAALGLRRYGVAGVAQAALSQAESGLRRQVSAGAPQLWALDMLKLLWALRALRV
jgi:glycosyltransferase involved in cell wall biosynthesis